MMQKEMRLPGFTAEGSLYQTSGHYQAGGTAPRVPADRQIEPAYRCNAYLLAKCLIFGEGDCYDKHCPIVQ